MSIDKTSALTSVGCLAQTKASGLLPRSPISTDIAWPIGYGFRAAHQVQLLVDVSMHMIKFDSDEFSVEAFRIHRVDCSADIARSVRKRQAEYFYGRSAARLALQEHGLSHVAVIAGAFRQPIWPSGIVGSITHNTNHAAAIALSGQEFSGIGIDIESVVPAELQADVKAVVLSQLEAEYLSRLTSKLAFASLLSIAFSAKESFFKAVFHEVGHYFDFSAVHICDLDLVNKTIELIVQQKLSLRIKEGDAFLTHFGWIDDETICTYCTYRR